MRQKLKPLAIVSLIATLMITSAGVAIADQPTLDWGTEVNLDQCGPGPLVINVTEKVVNSLDSGVLSWWAYESYNRQIRVRQTSPSTFCAVVRYQGDFTTVGGPSPNGTDSNIAAGIRGTFEGGYRATITGSLLSITSPTRGHVSVTDHQCTWTDSDSDGIFDYGEESCPGRIDWTAQYFSLTGFNFDWWGWIYNTESNGTWVNAITGNQGDITD